MSTPVSASGRSQPPLLQGPCGTLEAAIHQPLHTPVGVAVISHPHPPQGGNMDNKVVQTLAKAFVMAGWTAIRYQFRGVGGSAGTYDEGRGEQQDLLAVIAQCAGQGPLALAGFSFGAYVTSQVLGHLAAQQRKVEKVVLVGTAAGKWDVATLDPGLHEHTLVIHGENDEVIALADCLAWARPQNLPVTVVPQGGHFFHGQLTLLRRLVVQHLKP